MNKEIKNIISIVNDNDEIIGYKDRLKVDYKKDIYRVSALWITDFDGNILLAKRAMTKKHHPGLFGPAVAGTVEKGELYVDNIKKEAKEELGLVNIEIKEIGKEFHSAQYTHFTTWFLTKIKKNTSLFLQKEEVESVRWFSKQELIELFKEKPEIFLESLIEKFEFINELINKKDNSKI